MGACQGTCPAYPSLCCRSSQYVAVRVVERDQAPRGNVEGRAVEREALGLEFLVRDVHTLDLELHARVASTGARRSLGEEQVRVLGKKATHLIFVYEADPCTSRNRKWPDGVRGPVSSLTDDKH